MGKRHKKDDARQKFAARFRLSAVARLRDTLSVLMAIGGGGVFTELRD